MLQLCRTCHGEVTTDDCIAINDNNVNSARVKSQLLSCIPELQQDLVKDPVMCSPCVDALNFAYAFKAQSLQTEKRIRKYFENANLNAKSLTLVELYKEVGVTYNLLKGDDSIVKSTNNVACNDEESNDTNDLMVKQQELPYVNREANKEGNVSSNEVIHADVSNEVVGNITCDNDLENKEIVKEEHDIAQFKFKVDDVDFNKKNNRSRDIEWDKLSLLTLLDESLQITRTQFENSVEFGGFQDLPPRQSGNALVTTSSPTRSEYESSRMKLSTHGKEQGSLLTENLSSNVVIDTGEKVYGCTVCKFRTSLRRSLIQHVRSHTEEEPLRCNVSDCCTRKRTNLKRHMRTNSGEKPFRCTICEFRTTQRGHLKSHLRTHTGEKPFRCTICKFRTMYRCSLKSHMRTHTGEKPFRCTICEFRTAQRCHLKSHMRTHTGEKPFRCTICEFRTAQRSHLKLHMRTHTGEKPFRCTICEFRTAQRGHLKLHMRLHTGEKPFRCTICEFRTAQRGHLKLHMRTHTGEKPFRCTICEFRTAQRSHLKLHMRIHSDEKAFVCTICEFRAKQRSTLKSHMRTHSGEKPFRCNICEYCCAHQTGLSRHMMATHKE